MEQQLAGRIDLANHFGVAVVTIDKWREKWKDFPPVVQYLNGNSPMWDLAAVEECRERHEPQQKHAPRKAAK